MTRDTIICAMLKEVQKMMVPTRVMKAPMKVVNRLPRRLPAHIQKREPQIPPRLEAPLTVPWMRLLWSFKCPFVVAVFSWGK